MMRRCAGSGRRPILRMVRCAGLSAEADIVDIGTLEQGLDNAEKITGCGRVYRHRFRRRKPGEGKLRKRVDLLGTKKTDATRSHRQKPVVTKAACRMRYVRKSHSEVVLSGMRHFCLAQPGSLTKKDGRSQLLQTGRIKSVSTHKRVGPRCFPWYHKERATLQPVSEGALRKTSSVGVKNTPTRFLKDIKCSSAKRGK